MHPRKPIPDNQIYPDNWDKEVVPRIMKRANDCCEVCGIKHWQRVYNFKILVRNKANILKDYYVSFVNMDEAKRECPYNQEVKISNAILRVILKGSGPIPVNFTDDMLHAVCQSCEQRTKNRTRKDGI